MLFCEACGSLKKAVRRRGNMEHRCATCEPGALASPAERRAARAAHEQRPPTRARTPDEPVYEASFERADKLLEPTGHGRRGPGNDRSSGTGARSGSGAQGRTFERVRMEPTFAEDRRARQAPQGRVPGAADLSKARTGEAPEGAGPFFPFPEMRKGQADFVRDVRQALTDRKVLVAQVPTGLGKTAGVLSPALQVARQVAADEGCKVFFLTPKQSQHRVVIDTLKLSEKASGTSLVVSDMISKKAMCPRSESETLNARAFGEFCSNAMVKGSCSYYETDETEVFRELARDIHAVEHAVDRCTQEHVCPYKALTQVGRIADVLVLDYNHFFSDLLDATMDRFNVTLDNAILVVDEAHNLPDRIRDHLSQDLRASLLNDAAHEARQAGAYPVAKFLDLLREFVERLDGKPETKLRVEDLVEPMERMVERAFPLARPDLHGVVDELEEVAEKVLKRESYSACEEVSVFLRTWPPSATVPEDAVLRMWDAENGAVVHKVLDAAVLARPIFERVRGAVVMSGTLFPMEMYGSLLGVPAERAEYKLYGNPFPPENRRVVIDPGVSTAMRERGPATYQAIADRISAVCQATPGNVAAFFTSYDFLERVAERTNTTGRRMLSEQRGMDKVARERLVDRLRAADGKALLLGVQGGSLSEGYDFVEGGENLLSSVLVVGVPYGVPTLEVKSLQALFDKRYGQGKGWLYGYLAPALQRTLQAAGRAVRAAHHRAFVAFLDHRYGQRNVQQWMPPDLNPTMEPDIGQACTRFFADR